MLIFLFLFVHWQAVISWRVSNRSFKYILACLFLCPFVCSICIVPSFLPLLSSYLRLLGCLVIHSLGQSVSNSFAVSLWMFFCCFYFVLGTLLICWSADLCFPSVPLNPQLEDLLLRMLIKDPKERITIPQIKVSTKVIIGYGNT